MANQSFHHALCVYPYRRELNHAGFFPPLGLECIAAVIQPYAQKLDVVDFRKDRKRTKDFLQPQTDLVCFSVNWDRDIDFLREEIRSVTPGIFTIVGGRFATEDPQRWLSEFPGVSAVIRGDGEEAMSEICRGVPLADIAGLSFRDNGRIVHNPNRKTGPVQDDIYPDRRLRRYVYDAQFEGAGTGIQIDTIAGSRGCPFNCTFCEFSRNPWGEKRSWSARSPESIVEEISRIQAPFVAFTDDLFTYDMDRVEQICDRILARGIRKKYIINARLEIAKRPDVLRKMEQAGFVFLMLGIESTQDRTLRSMRKGFNTNQIREYFKVLRESSMIFHGYFILGNIGETVEEMRTISAFAHELGLDTIAISTLRSSRYSGLAELVAQSPGYHIAPNGKIYSDSCSVTELRHLRRQINRDFFNAAQIVKLAKKAVRNGALRFIPPLLVRLPNLTWQTVKQSRNKTRRRKEKALKRKTLLLQGTE